MQLLPIEFAIKAVLIAVGTAGVLRILNVKTAAARHAAWAGVVVVMLLLPAWTVWGPKVALHWLPPLPNQAATYVVAAAGSLEPAAGSPLAPRHSSWNWTACLLGIYLVGVAVFLARLALGTLQAQLLVRRAFSSGGRLFSEACGAPVTVGWLRPLVVLPESWSRWPAAQLDAVLTHEHEHARRRDPLFQWLALLNRAVFWFHPLAWWLERRMAALAEEACDAVVLAHGHDPRDYSKYLIDMARSVSSSGARIQVWGTAMPGGFLEERLRRILEGGPIPRLSRTRLVCAFIACAATSAAFATSTLDRQRPALQADRKVVFVQPPANSSNGNPTVPATNQEAVLRQQSEPPAPQPPSPPAAGAPSGNILTDVPRTLHVDIQGLSDEAAAELRQRLALREGEVFDHAAFVKELERIHQIVSEFDPHLNDSRAVGKVARKTGADGKALPPDRMDVTVIIAPRDPAPQGELQQFSKIAKPPSFENVPIKLHVDIQGLSPEAAAELRQRLAVAEGETTDMEALKKTEARIRQVMKYFDPRLTDEMNFDLPPRKFGADGQPISWESVAATIVIKLKP